MPVVTVIVVNFNTREQLRRCLATIAPEHKIVVIDNASGDGSPEMVVNNFPSVVLIITPKTAGSALRTIKVSMQQLRNWFFASTATPGATPVLTR